MASSTRAQSSWWRVFLSPGWVIFILLIIAFSWAAFSVLAPWQLNKDEDIVARNAHIEEAFRTEPVDYSQVLDAHGAIATQEWTRVTISGQYLPESEVLLRLRPEEGAGPSYQSLVAFRSSTGDVILVNRGWIAAGEANAVPDIPPPPATPTTITGMVRFGEGRHPNDPIFQENYWQVYSIHSPQLAEIMELPLSTDYVQLSAGESGELRAIPVPMIDRGNHLSYGFQWIAFGIMAPLGLIYFIYAEVRERRRVAAEEAELAAAAAPDTHPDAAATPETEAAVSQRPDSSEPRRRARYGTAKPNHYEKFNRRDRDRF